MKIALYILLPFFLFTTSFEGEQTKPYSVYVFLHDECIISRYYTIPLQALDQEFSELADFIGVFPNPQMTDERLKQFAKDYKISFDVVSDPTYKLVNELNATVTPEVMVVEHASNHIIYSGRIDNAYARVGKKRTVVTQHELRDVLAALQRGETPKTQSQPAIGCIITQIKSN